MQDDLENAPDFYKSNGVCWNQIIKNVESLFESEGIVDVQSQGYNQNFSLIDMYYSPVHYFRCALWLFYQHIRQKDKHHVLEKTEALIPHNRNLLYNVRDICGRPNFNDGKNLTWDYLVSVNTIVNILEVYPELLTEKLVVADLGAGWGRIPYVLTQLNSNLCYLIFDIPHTLLLAQEYLERNIPENVPLHRYMANRDIPEFNKELLSQKRGIMFCGTQFLEKFTESSIDLLISVATFQEMLPAQVEDYFGIIDKTSSYFYNQQRYSDLEMEYGLYPYKSHWQKLFDKDCDFLPLWFESMFKL